MGNWREVSNPNSNTKVDTAKKNWRDAVGADKTDLESIKVKPYSVTAPVIDMPAASIASFSARKALNSRPVTEGVAPRIDSVSAPTMPNSNVAYWEKGMPKTAENQNKPVKDDKGNILKSVVGGLGTGVLNTIKGVQNASDLWLDKVEETIPALKGTRWYEPSDVANTMEKGVEKIQGWTDRQNASTARGYTEDLISSLPQMATMLIPGFGQAVFGLSAGGNYADEYAKKHPEASTNKKLAYGTIGGVGEVALNKVLELVPGYKKVFGEAFEKGALSKLTGNIATDAKTIGGSYVKNSLKEGIEEIAIDPVMGLTEKALGDKDKKWYGEDGVVDIKQMSYDGLGGLLMGGAFQAPAMAKQGTNIVAAKKYIETNYPDALAHAQALPDGTPSKDLSLELIQKNTNVTVQDVEDLVNAVQKDYADLGISSNQTQPQTKTIINAPGLQAEVVAQTPEGEIIQTESGQQMPVRNAFLQNAEMQEVNVNPAPVEQAKPQLTDDQKLDNAIKEIDTVKADHEAGKIETKDYLTKLADIDSRLYEDTSKTSQEALQQEKQVSLPNTQGTQNKGITEALMSGNGQAVMNKIKNDMKSQGIDANFEVIKGTTAFHKDIKKLAKGLGVEVVFYKGDKVPNGFISNSVKNTIFIHSNGQRNDMVATTGHEFLHHVKKTYAKEYGELLNFAKTYFTKEAREAFLDTYSNVPSLQADLAANEDSLLEEMLADEMGNNFVDKNFWQRVYEHSKELFEKLVEAAGKILKSVSGEKYDTYVAQETADTLSKKFESVIAEVRKQVAERKIDTEARILEESGIQLSSDKDSFAPISYNARTYTPESKKKIVQVAEKNDIASPEEVYAYLKALDNVMATIIADAERLDFQESNVYKALKNNSDPHYKESLDFTTLCKKRIVLQGTIEKIQSTLGRGLTQDEWLDVRNELNKQGIEVSCGACYVDTRRMEMGLRANQYIENNIMKKQWYAHDKIKNNVPYPSELPPKQWFYTQEGLDQMKEEYPDIYKDFNSKTGARGIKAPESRTAYRNEIMDMLQSRVDALNSKAGLRWQSWSDFEVPHLLDGMQAIMDMWARKLKSHAYTKVENFVRAFGKTGMMINMSLIPKGKGLDANGNLVFDSKEGMAFETTLKYRDMFPNTVGNITIGVKDDFIRAAMRDDRMDYIIPYHASGLSLAKRTSLGIGMEEWDDYTNFQNPLKKEIWDKAGENAFTKPSKELKKYAKNFKGNLPDLYDMWDYSKSPQQNVLAYTSELNKLGAVPPFPQFSNEPNYWKVLIDRKMVNHITGENIIQQPVKPEFDEEVLQDILKNYKGEHTEEQYHSPTVDKLVDQFSRRTRSITNSKLTMKDAKKNDTQFSTRSKEFKQWFGDSKVKDEAGEPKVIYHGTSNAGFNMFDTYGSNYGLFGQGSYFTEDANIASQYTEKGRGKAKGIYPVYARVEFPLDMDKPAKKFMWEDMFPEIDFEGITTNESAYRQVEEWYEYEEWPKWEASEDIIGRIQEAGYDGITHIGGSRVKKSDGTRHRVWITFEPNQVKSAVGNNGQYSNDSVDIRESVRQKERQHYSKQYNNSEAMDDEVYNRISDEAKFIDERMSIKSVAEEADKRVKANPKKYIDKIRDSESFGTPEDVAEAEYALLTVQQAAREFDKQGDKTKAEQQWNIASSIASKIITHFSTASRTLNMGKLWRMLDSQGVIRIAEKMLDKETTPEQKKKLRTEAGELIKAINKLDEKGLSKIKEALGFDKDVEVTAQEILDEAEYSRDSNFDEVDERVKEVAELFDTIEARNAKKIADKVKSSIKSVLEGIDFGIKFMARGLELNTSESVNDKIARLTEEYYSKPLSERGNLAKILAKELNIPMVQADTIAKRINDTMKEVTREEKLKSLKGKETSEGKKTAIEKWLTPKMRKSPEVKSWIDRIVELSESGSLTKEDLLPLIAAKYDFKVMTPEISRNLEDLAKNIQGLESDTDEYNRAVNALNDYMNSLVKHDIFEHLNTIENLAMLSGTKSMMRNVIGNAGRLISYDVEKFGSALLDMAKATVSKNKTRTVLMPNIKGQIKGIGQGYYKELVDAITNTDSRSIEDTREFARYIKYKNKPMSIFQRYVKLLMTDRPFTQAMINEVVSEAEKLAKKNKVEFDISEARQIAEEEAAKTFFNGDDKVIDAVLNIRRIANGGKVWGLGSIVLKFAKVPYNVSKFAVEREYHLASMKILYKAISSGYGAIKGEDKGYLKDSKFDSKAFIQDIAKVGSGALVMHLGTLLFTLGMIRVRPDDDDKDKKLLGLEKLVGFNKYQLNLSAIRRYFVEGEFTKEPQEGDLLATLDWFAPLSILMIAGIKSQMEHEKKSMQPGERELAWYRKLWDYAVANPAAGIGEGILEQVNTVLEMPFLQSLNKFKYADNWQDGLMEVIKDIPARFVPAPVKYAKEAVDNTQRETYTDEATGVGEAINKVKVKLPGVSRNMEPKIDMLGNELELYQNAKNNFLNIAINPAISTRYQTTPEAKKLLDVYQRFGIKTHIPTPVDKKFTAKKSEYKSLEKDESIVLTAPEYRYYQQEYGLGVKKLLENFTVYDDPSYKTSQEKAANKLNDKYTELKQEIQRKILEKRGIK